MVHVIDVFTEIGYARSAPSILRVPFDRGITVIEYGGGVWIEDNDPNGAIVNISLSRS